MTAPSAAITPARPIRSIDLTYFKRDYRLVEPERERGAEVRPAGVSRGCCECPRVFHPESKVVRLSDRVRHLCLKCAMKHGVLVETPESIRRREEEAAAISAAVRAQAVEGR